MGTARPRTCSHEPFLDCSDWELQVFRNTSILRALCFSLRVFRSLTQVPFQTQALELLSTVPPVEGGTTSFFFLSHSLLTLVLAAALVEPALKKLKLS